MASQQISILDIWQRSEYVSSSRSDGFGFIYNSRMFSGILVNFAVVH